MNDRQQSKSELAYQWIRERIRTREFEPGHRLVLSAIASELNVSTVPVREAIRQLEAEGQVTYEHNVGARVSTLNREVYFQTMETLAVLEGYATALAVPHLTPTDLATAREFNDKMEALLDDFDAGAFTELNRQFHRVLFDRCPNRHLTEIVYTEWEKLDYLRVSTFRYIPNRAMESVAEHARMLDLIAAGAEPKYLEAQMRDHRMKTMEKYRDKLDESDRITGVDSFTKSGQLNA